MLASRASAVTLGLMAPRPPTALVRRPRVVQVVQVNRYDLKPTREALLKNLAVPAVCDGRLPAPCRSERWDL